jgi:hypothetical protein
MSMVGIVTDPDEGSRSGDGKLAWRRHVERSDQRSAPRHRHPRPGPADHPRQAAVKASTPGTSRRWRSSRYGNEIANLRRCLLANATTMVLGYASLKRPRKEWKR